MRQVKFKNNILNIVGRNIKVYDFAPDFRVVSSEMKDIFLNQFDEKIKIITTFPSLDTSVCDLQVREFNKKASNLSSDIVVIGISNDLPFAQKRFCELNNIKNVFVFSDYKYSSFGLNYGVLIKELKLLARTVIIVDKNNVVRYIQISEEITESLNYDDVMKNLEEIIKNPVVGKKSEIPSKCEPCEAGTPPLQKEQITKLLEKFDGWTLIEDKKIVKEYKFKDFIEAKYFVDLVSIVSEEQFHHPTITVSYNKVKISLTTHTSKGLTLNDFIMAQIIDQLYS